MAVCMTWYGMAAYSMTWNATVLLRMTWYGTTGLHGHLRGFFPSFLPFTSICSRHQKKQGQSKIKNILYEKKEIKTKNHRQKNEVKIQNREHPSFLPFHHLSVLKMRRNKVTWHKLADPTSHQGFTSSYHTLGSNKTASKKRNCWDA